MRIRRALLATAAMATLGVGVQAAPAAAQTCPVGYVCMFEDAFYRGDMYVRVPAESFVISSC
ncbi:peptidase inhibitor family I36 protein [Spirillospora sp. CA-294931]|uniref:peptidase inhibitor family I36 protein n=1 Tax=Spirillospora sp. CA-294931 TaxID=3240042 RepID=UPI003D90F452